MLLAAKPKREPPADFTAAQTLPLSRHHHPSLHASAERQRLREGVWEADGRARGCTQRRHFKQAPENVYLAQSPVPHRHPRRRLRRRRPSPRGSRSPPRTRHSGSTIKRCGLLFRITRSFLALSFWRDLNAVLCRCCSHSGASSALPLHYWLLVLACANWGE